MKKMLLLALLLAGLSFLWMMPFCYYIHDGWCADWTPIILGVMIPPVWFAVGLVLFLIAWQLEKRSKIREGRILRWAPFAVMLVSGVFFVTAETLRTCVIDASDDGDDSVLRMCLNLGGRVESKRHFNGPTALWVAVSMRRVDVIDTLLARGARVQSDSPCDSYAPIMALRTFSPTVVDEEIRQKLIKAGAEVCP